MDKNMEKTEKNFESIHFLTFFGGFSNIFFIFSWIFDKILKYGRKIWEKWENMDEIWKYG
jgi:hypothetical protein